MLRYVGSKKRLIPEILHRMPKEYNWLVEPFCGSATLFFNQDHPAMLNDICGELISYLVALRDDPKGVWERFNLLDMDAETYYLVRRLYNAGGGAHNFLYLNTYGYRGLWRTNKSGEYNVPYSRAGARPTHVQLLSESAKLQQAYLTNLDYSCMAPREDDFVYCDPPYPDMYQYGEEFDYRRFVKWTRDLDCKTMVSLPDTEECRNWYDGWYIDEVSVRQTVQRGTSRRRSELLIRNYSSESDSEE